MIFVPKLWCSLNKGGLHFKYVLNFWQIGRDKALKIGTVQLKLTCMVSLPIYTGSDTFLRVSWINIEIKWKKMFFLIQKELTKYERMLQIAFFLFK